MIGVIGIVVFKVFLNPVTNHWANPMGPMVHLIRGLGCSDFPLNQSIDTPHQIMQSY